MADNSALKFGRLGGCFGGLRTEGRIIHLPASSVANFEPPNPEENVFGDICRVVGDALQVARSQHEMKIGGDERRVLTHPGQQAFENAVAILVNNVVAFENLGRQLDVAVDQSAQAP